MRSGLDLVRPIVAACCEPAYLHETEKIRQDRFRTLVFIEPVWVKPIRTTARDRSR